MLVAVGVNVEKGRCCDGVDGDGGVCVCVWKGEPWNANRAIVGGVPIGEMVGDVSGQRDVLLGMGFVRIE